MSGCHLSVYVQLHLCGQTPETALNSALAAVTFYVKQQELHYQMRETQFKKRLQKVQEQCKQKLAEVHTGYQMVKPTQSWDVPLGHATALIWMFIDGFVKFFHFFFFFDLKGWVGFSFVCEVSISQWLEWWMYFWLSGGELLTGFGWMHCGDCFWRDLIIC